MNSVGGASISGIWIVITPGEDFVVPALIPAGERCAFGILRRAARKSSVEPASAVTVSATGKLIVNLAFSSMHDLSQICHFAAALKVKVSPGEREAGGVISMRKTGDPL